MIHYVIKMAAIEKMASTVCFIVIHVFKFIGYFLVDVITPVTSTDSSIKFIIHLLTLSSSAWSNNRPAGHMRPKDRIFATRKLSQY